MPYRFVLTLLLLPVVTQPAVGAPAVTVRVDARVSGARVSEHLYGNNLKSWGGAGELLWDAGKQDLNAEAVERLKGLGATVLRFPGGSHAEKYRWRDAVGPQRGGTTTQFTFGTDEFLRFCRELGAEPMITANWGAGPEEAAAWVEYCNGAATTPMGRLRAANGHPEPYGVRYWELGNENYNKVPAKTYADSLPAFARAMKGVDASIRLGGVGWAWPNWRSHYTKEADPWNETVLARAGAHLDALIIHPYCWLDPKPPAERLNAGLARSILAWPAQMGREIAAVRDSAAAAGYPDLPFWFTEYNGYYGGQGMCAPLCHTVNGVLNAAMLHEFLRLGVPVANHWEMASAGWSHLAALSHPRADLWLLRPAWHILALYSRHVRGRLLPVAVDAPTYDHDAYSIIRKGTGTPVVDAVATRHAEGLTVALVNRDPEAAQRVTLEILGAPGVKAVQRHTFAGAAPFSGEFSVRSDTLPAASPLSLELPPCSATLLVLGE